AGSSSLARQSTVRRRCVQVIARSVFLSRFTSGRKFPLGRAPMMPQAIGRGDHHWRLKPAVRLFEVSPVGVSLTEPVTLKGPPNSFCSALSEGSHFSSVLEILAPNDTLVSVGETLNRSDWLLVQPWLCVVALGSGLVTARPFCTVAVTFSLTGAERLNVVPILLCCWDGSPRVSIEVWSQPSGN